MRKEVIWAAGIGIFFGVIIAFGAWRINSSFKPEQKKVEATTKPEPTSEFKITLDKPENDDVVTEDFVVTSGITKPLSWITISGEDGDYLVQALEDGTFKEEVSLIPGINQIKITAFDSVGNPSFEKVLVVFSSAFQTRTSTLSATPGQASDEASIRQKVIEKVEAALNKPKAYIGVVTDISDSTIQIKTAKGEIKQISVASEDISVVKSSGTTNKSVKLSDVAIGDFIAAMGYINDNSVLQGQRILITTPIIEPTIEVNFGTIKTYLKDLVITSKIDSSESKITLSKNTNIYEYTAAKKTKIKQADLDADSLIIYVNSGTTVTPIIRTIFVVQKPQTETN